MNVFSCVYEEFDDEDEKGKHDEQMVRFFLTFFFAGHKL